MTTAFPLSVPPSHSTAAPGGTSYDNDEAFIDAFATLRARENLETYDASFETYRAIGADVRREGRVPPLAKSKPRPRPANKVVLVLGAPGTDKGWHCANLARDYGFTRISAADMLREEVEAEMSGLDAWEMWKSTISAGEWLHSTDATLRMISSAMARAGPNAKFLIDWFPRDLDQVKEFHERVCAVDFVLYLDVEPPRRRASTEDRTTRRTPSESGSRRSLRNTARVSTTTRRRGWCIACVRPETGCTSPSTGTDPP